MKIGVIVGKFPVISEQFILNHIAGLIDQGHEVTVLAAARGSTDRVQPMVAEYRLLDRTLFADVPAKPVTRVLRLLLLTIRNALLRPRRLLRAFSRQRYRTGVTSGKTVFFLNAFSRLRFDLLYAHFGPNGLSGAFLKDIGVAPRLAVAFHGSDINTYPKRFGEDVYSYMFTRCDLVTANTTFTAGKVVSVGAAPEQMAIVPESLRTDEYPPRTWTRKDDGFRVLTVGRMVEKKGHRYVLEAIATLRKVIPGLRYRMVGDGSLRRGLGAQAQALGIADICDFLGAQTADVVRKEYAECDVFVLASVTAAGGDMEGQGLVLQEAQAMGVPVVSTYHNGIPDGILEGETGVLVPEGDVEGLHRALESFWRDPESIASMGRRAAEFVRERYDTAAVTQKLEVTLRNRFSEWRTPSRS